MISVVSIRLSVVLPAPLGPSRPKTSPLGHLEVDVIDGGEIAEALSQFQRPNRCRFGFHYSRERDFGRHARVSLRRSACSTRTLT